MSFNDYLKNRQNALQQMTESLKQSTQTEFKKEDDRMWKPQMGQDGTGYAVIRFLPGSDTNKTPWVKVFDHGFQGPTGKWYIENSLTTLGQKDPVSEHNTRLWNSGVESNKDIVRKQKRRTSYYANVFVIKDPANPAAEGKVKIFKFGQKIFEKLMGALNPEFAGDDPLNPFDIIDGANFRIKLRMVAGYWNYDASEFERPSPLAKEDDKLEAIFNAQHDVHELISPDKFKSYEELSAKLQEVLGTQGAAVSASVEPVQAPKALKVEKVVATAATTKVSEDDDLEAYFKNLSKE